MDPNRYKQKSKLELPFHDGKLWLKRNVCKLMPKCPAFCWTGTSDVKVTNKKKKKPVYFFISLIDYCTLSVVEREWGRQPADQSVSQSALLAVYKASQSWRMA